MKKQNILIILNKYLRYQFQSEVKSEMNTAFYLSTTRQTNSQIHTHVSK